MVVASLPVLQLIILKAVFYQDPFLLFLNPPSLRSFWPQRFKRQWNISKKEKTKGAWLLYGIAESQKTDASWWKNIFTQKTGFKFWQPRWVFFHSLVKPLMFQVFCGLHIGLTCRLITWTPSYAKDMLSGLFLILNLNLQTLCVCTTFFYLLVFLLCIKMVYTQSVYIQSNIFFNILTLMTFSGNQL